MDDSVLEYFDIFLLVLAGMGGLVFIDPVFSRRGVPPMVRTGLVLVLSLLIAPGVRSGAGQVMVFSTLDMAKSPIRGVILGLVIGCVFHIFSCMFYVAGGFLNTVFGLAIGKIMGPAGGAQTFILGRFVNVFFYLYFFVTGYHLTMVHLFTYNYQVMSVGAGAILGGRILWYIIILFDSVFLMVTKLVLPFMAVEFILEITTGALMELIPQIRVLVINIQCKVLLGIMLMMLFTYPIGTLMGRYIETMMTEAQKLLMMLG